MNRESTELLHQLEQATSSGPVDPQLLDDETFLLRENWLAFGKLLKAAEVEPQPGQVVELQPMELQQTVPARGNLKTRNLKTRNLKRWAWGYAASALAVAGIWFGIQSAFLRNTFERTVANGFQPRDNSQTDSATETALPSVTSLAWDDGLENDLTSTVRALQQFRGERGVHDASLLRLEDQFQELARDFELGSL